MTLATTALNCAKQLGRVNAAGTAIADLETEIKAEIGETIRFYNRQKYALTEFRGGLLTTTSGTTWYSSVDLTSGDGDQSKTSRTAVDTNTILGITYMRDNTGSIYDRMRQIPYQEFEGLFEGSTPQSSPSYWTMWAGQIGVWPTPDAAYTLYFSAHVKAPVPTGDSDTSVWLTEAGEMIEAGACKRVCLKYLRDSERAAEFAVVEETARQNLAREYILKSSSGKIKAHS